MVEYPRLAAIRLRLEDPLPASTMACSLVELRLQFDPLQFGKDAFQDTLVDPSSATHVDRVPGTEPLHVLSDPAVAWCRNVACILVMLVPVVSVGHPDIVANGIDTFSDDVGRAVPAVDPTL